MNHLKENAQKACIYVNQKLDLQNAECCVLNDASEIDAIYATYTGPKEFLYIPTYDEILDTVYSDDAVYLGYRIDGELVAIAKLSKLEIPSSFFVPPKTEGTKADYYGCSGLLVKDGNRGKKLAQRLVNLASSIAYVNGGKGIYADFDYRNSASMHVISKLFNFVGFVDGRNGAEGEQTIYTTFYLPLKNRENLKMKGKNVRIPCHTCDDAKTQLLKVMSQEGSFAAYKVPYGGENHYNMIYCLDKAADFDKFEITREMEGVKDSESYR